MAQTENLGLVLTEASETSMSFLAWRQIINGSNDSNAKKIDAAIGELQDKFSNYADGLIYNADTGVLQLSSGGVALKGDNASVTIKLSDYCTKAEVDDLISKIPGGGGTVDLSNYYTRAETDSKINEVVNSIPEVDLSNYYTRPETEQYVTDAMNDLAGNSAIEDIHSRAVGTLEYDTTTYELTTKNLNGETIGDPIVIKGGGGGGDSYAVRLINGMPATIFTVAYGAQTLISATYNEYYGTDPTGSSGVLTVSYKLSTSEDWTVFTKQNVQHGVSFSFDITSLLQEGKTTDIELSVVGGESGQTRTLTYSITAVEATISAINYDPAAVYTGDINFQYKCMGRNLKKTVHFLIDGVEYAQADIGTSHNATLTQQIKLVGNYSYGAHLLTVYFETDTGARSNELSLAVLYNDGSSTAPMISAIPVANEITYGDSLGVNYILFTPGQEITDTLSIRVYSSEDGVETEYASTSLADIPNSKQYTWQTVNYPSVGTAYIELTSDETTITVRVLVKEIQTGYDLNPVSTSLVYSYSASGRSNNDSNKGLYEYEYTTGSGVTTKIKGVFGGFNWVSNGYLDGSSLTLSGEAKHTIKLPIFSTSYTDDDGQTVSLESSSGASVTTNGRTVEIEFELSNVTDINAQVIKCMSADHAGFIVTPQTCYLLASNGADVALDDTGFIENEESIAAAYIKDNSRIRLSFVIEPKGSVQYEDGGQTVTGQCVNIYINGQFANSFPYSDNARFGQSEFISIGDNSCIMNVYDIRIYNRGLTTTEICQNYKASPISIQDRITRFQDNDVLNDDGDVDYDKAIEKYACLLVTGPLSPYKGANGVKTPGKYESGVTLTKPDGNGSHTVEFNLLDKDSDGVWVSSNNVQGTSSVKFPVKNYKVYLAKMGTDELGAPIKKKVKYSLKGKDPVTGDDLSIGESTLCWKGDYMSSDHANTFNANLADTLYNDVTASQDPAQGGDARVQNTVYGFRCLLFRRDDVDGKIEFIGDGCLNNDKGNTKTFGLECDGDSGNVTKRQKWEFLNNTETLCSFLTDRFQEDIVSDTETKKRVTAGLESSYPDQGDLEDEGLTPNYDYMQSLFTWVYQRANFWQASTDALETPLSYNSATYTTERDYRKAIFKNEFTRHFDLNHTLVYYLFSEFIALCDNRAKNMFMKSEDVTIESLLDTSGAALNINTIIEAGTGEVHADQIDWENSTFAVWYPVLYDLDSCFGVENSGYMQIPYYADWNYKLNGVQKFNGRESLLWLMFEEAFSSEIEAKAKVLTNRDSGNGGLNYEALYDYHIKNNAKLMCPAVINQDMETKYTDPWIKGFVNYAVEGTPLQHISDYKYLQRGDRTEQKDAFIYKRCNMLYSKYRCDKFINNNINFRVGANGGVPATNTGITITASQALYPAVKYGDGAAAVVSASKTAAGVSVTITKPGTTEHDKVGFSDTVYIAGGKLLTDIGDISKFRPYELQLQNATSLKKLTIGSSEDGYANAQLKAIDTSACKILDELNIMGCTGIVGNVDLSRNGLIRKVFASKSGASSITLPVGGVLEELHLGSVSDIEVLNHTALQTFTCDSYDNLTSLRVENTPNIPVMDIVKERLPYLTNGLRLVGVDADIGDDQSIFDLLLSSTAKGKYIDNNGTLSEDKDAYPYISGTITCSRIGSYVLENMNKTYPYLTIKYTTLVNQYSATFMNGDEVYDVQYIMHGQSALNPITRSVNPLPAPTKESTDAVDYTFSGWSGAWKNANETAAITSNVVFNAEYTETPREYTVRWKYYKGTNTQVSKSIKVLYGESAEFVDEDLENNIPVRAAQSTDDMGHYWLFDHWDKSTACVTGDITVNAVFSEAYLNDTCTKSLSNMTPVDLYALVQGGKLEMTREGSVFKNNNSYISCADTIDVVLGKDYDCDNIHSLELVSADDPKEFSGTSGSYYLPQDEQGNDVTPFKDGESFVLAVDFEFDKAAAENRVLMSCFSSNNGFKLQCAKIDNSSVLNGFVYGGQSKTSVSTIAVNNVRFDSTTSTASDREIVVIRKIKGDDNLYIYSSSKSENSINEAVLTGAFLSASGDGAASYKNAPIAFGANVTTAGASAACKGKIHWSKLWYGDIGVNACREIVSWPRQRITLVATGKDSDDVHNLYVDTVASGSASHCCFILQGLLGAVHTFNPAGEIGSWENSDIRSWVSARLIKAFPTQWQALFVDGKLQSGCSDGSTTETVDTIWVPSAKDMGDSVDTETTSPFTIFYDSNSRIKTSPITGSAAGYFTRTFAPNTASYRYIRGVSNGGGFENFTVSNTTKRDVCFGLFI